MNIKYVGVTTGTITIETKKDTRLGDSDVYHISARAKTASFYSYLYEVDDICDSYISKDYFIPLKFSLIQRESSQDIDDLQLFDLAEHKTYSFYKRVTKKKSNKKKIVKNIPNLYQDPLSILYFIRGLPMILNKPYSIPIVNQGKIEMFNVTYDKKVRLSTKIGTKDAYRVRINTKAKGQTIKGGDMIFWFTADAKRIFIKFEAKIKIGSIHGEIESYRE